MTRAIAIGLILAALAGCGGDKAGNADAAANGQQSVRIDEPIEDGGNGSGITAIDAATGDARGLAPDISPTEAAALRPSPSTPSRPRPSPAPADEVPAPGNAGNAGNAASAGNISTP